MDLAVISIIISALSLLSVFFFNLMTLLYNMKNSKRTNTNGLKEEIEDKTQTKVMLEMINKTTQKIEIKVESINDRLIKVEESARYAHERIENLSKRIEEMEDDK